MSNYSSSEYLDDPNTSWQKTFQLIPAKSTVLDIGCSTGTFGERLIKEKQCTVDGIEIDERDLKAARQKLRKVYNIQIETEDIKVDDKYDIVFFGDVIEHLARPAQALNKVHALLKPGGRLVFSIPNITHMSVRLMLMSGKIKYGRTGLLDETHLHFYSQEEVYRVLNEAGFAVETFDYTINDIPEPVLKQELKKLGLTADAEFIKLSQSVNAAAYQFIGVAKPAKVKSQKLPPVSPLNTITKYLDEFNRANDKNLKAVVADRDRIQAENNRLRAENDKFKRVWYRQAARLAKSKLSSSKSTKTEGQK